MGRGASRGNETREVTSEVTEVAAKNASWSEEGQPLKASIQLWVATGSLMPTPSACIASESGLAAW